MLNEGQIKSLVRWVLSCLGAYMATRGIMDASEMSTLSAAVDVMIGPAMVIGSLVWSQIHHGKTYKK